MEKNPGNRAGRIDAESFSRMSWSVETLALAYHFTGRERYAKKAVGFLRTWLLQPETRMTPHLRYAGLVPGADGPINQGIFEFRGITSVVDAVDLLRGSYAWTAGDESAFFGWLSRYHRWLTTSEQGQAASLMPNHCGTWFDVQAARIALALFRNDDARTILQQALTKRLGLQIMTNGSQPLELARTRPLACSITNLDGLVRLASMGELAGVGWWTHVTPERATLRGAVAYLNRALGAQFESASETERREQATHFAAVLTRANAYLSAEERQSLASLAECAPAAARWRLFVQTDGAR